MTHVLAIDQGTTSTRAIVFDTALLPISVSQEEFTQYFPQSGWVEHDLCDLWKTTVKTCRKAIESAGLNSKDIAALGITNQRETTIVWDKTTGEAIHRAIVWQDRRTEPICALLRSNGHEPMFSKITGLVLDPISPVQTEMAFRQCRGAEPGQRMEISYLEQ